MELIAVIILGIVQGITEFLPISSSGHLILARELLGMEAQNGLAFDAVLQLATGLAVVAYFWRDLVRLFKSAVSYVSGKGIDATDRTLIVAIILGTIPAVIAGLLLETKMETVFRSASLVALMLIAGSVVMAGGELVAARYARGPLTIKKGVGIGLFQCLALIPGFSRSGATISGGLLLGLTRENAARFGFLLSVPIILGSGLKKLFELETGNSIGLPLVAGSLVAFIVGLSAIHFLMRYLKTRTLWVFMWYRLALAAVVLLLVF